MRRRIIYLKESGNWLDSLEGGEGCREKLIYKAEIEVNGLAGCLVSEFIAGGSFGQADCHNLV